MTEETRTRVLRLLDFLADLDVRRHPVVHDVTALRHYRLRDRDLPTAAGVRLTPGGEHWLAVDYLEVPEAPQVPLDLQPRLGRAVTAEHRPELDRSGDLQTPAALADELLTDDLSTRAQDWVVEEWWPWSRQVLAADAVRRLHRELCEQRERLAADRDAVELVVGFGRLVWSAPAATGADVDRAPERVRVDHPLLTVPVELELDPADQQMRLVPTGAAELETGFLAGLAPVDRAGLLAAREQVRDQGLDPWDVPRLCELLTAVVECLDPVGELVEDAGAEEPGPVPRVDAGWTLQVRPRRPDYQGFVEELRTVCRDPRAELPLPLLALVSDEPSTLTGGSPDLEPDGEVHAAGAASGMLLPLAANEEQERILRLARVRPGVTVQGPPGTGKSHTIANLICHYAATGRRVLVVAEKEQALQVLADKIPPGLRDLTVSVLGSDADGRHRLEAAVARIQSRVTALDPEHSDREIDRLGRELAHLDQALEDVVEKLVRAREAQTRVLPGPWTAGPDLTPARAAAWLTATEDRLELIDDAVPVRVPCPLDEAGFAELFDLARRIGVARAEQAAPELPDVADLPTGTALTELLTTHETLGGLRRTWSGWVRHWDQVAAAGEAAVTALGGRCTDQLAWVNRVHGTWVGEVAARAADAGLAREWRRAWDRLSQDRFEAIQLRLSLAAHTVQVPVEADPALTEHLHDAREKLAEGGRLGRFARDARRVVELCRVDGRIPTTAVEVELCLAAVRLNAVRHELVTRWNGEFVRLGAPGVDGPLPEDLIGPHLREVSDALEAHLAWNGLREDLAAVGIATPERMDPEICADVADAAEAARLHFEWLAVDRSLAQLRDRLRTAAAAPISSPLFGQLAEALAAGDAQAWQRALDSARVLAVHQGPARRFAELRERLSAHAPRWADRLLRDPGAAPPPGSCVQAWEWARLDTWVKEVDRDSDDAWLRNSMEELQLRRRHVVADLASERAWRRLADGMGDRQRQALNSYLKAVTRYGKTGGKFARRWLAEIRVSLAQARRAVPVWIMPTSRALSSFRPETVPPFDVLIVDEASQLGVEALPLLGLARTTVVVGDDQQTSPEHVGLDRQLVFGLLDDHLERVPGYRTLFDPDNSLYDLAFQKFPDVVMLTEHFRSLPPIIAFSDELCYDGRIVPLRDRAPRPDWPALRSVRVDGRRTGAVNPVEADAVVELVARLCADPDYAGMDFGVISLLGVEHSRLIWEKLYDRIGPEEMRRRRIRCGEPANFQGDERNVVVLSLVVSADGEAGVSGRIAPMTGAPAMRRLNVAASRARDQLWVVHSVEPEDLPAGDLRARLLRHVRGPAAVGPVSVRAGEEGAELEACQSLFERDVLGALLARGPRRVQVQYQVGRCRIDFVVEGEDGRRLAVQCDGDHWDGPRAWRRELAREQVLGRAGWPVVRIRASRFYRDRETAMGPVWPLSESPSASAASSSASSAGSVISAGPVLSGALVPSVISSGAGAAAPTEIVLPTGSDVLDLDRPGASVPPAAVPPTTSTEEATDGAGRSG